MSRFEGSYGGDAARISDAAVLECKICWTVYDPAQGDETRQIPPGTPFSALPEDWRCPHCDGERAQFMVLSDRAASPAPAPQSRASELASAFEAEFVEIQNAKMRDTPFLNAALQVQAVGFRDWSGGVIGVLVTPWFMNLMLAPPEGVDWSGLTPGAKEVIGFPSGEYEFAHNVRPQTGGYKSCALFSPMGDFASQLAAVDVARAALAALFDPAHRDLDDDRGADIRARREAGLAPPAAAPSRRKLVTGGAAG